MIGIVYLSKAVVFLKEGTTLEMATLHRVAVLAYFFSFPQSVIPFVGRFVSRWEVPFHSLLFGFFLNDSFCLACWG